MAIALDQALARNIRALRERRGWRQADVAERLSALGFAWTANRVAQIETLRRKVELLELAGLCWAFDCSVADLLTGDDEIELATPGLTVPLADVTAALLNQPSSRTPPSLPATEPTTASEEGRKASGRLGVPALDVDRYALRVFGHSLAAERDRRAGDLSAMPKRSAQARRGHVMRTLIEEIGTGMATERARYLKRLRARSSEADDQ